MTVRTLLETGPADDPGLIRKLVELAAGERFDGVASAGGELWFAIEGSGRLDCAGGAGSAGAGLEFGADTGLLVPPGQAFQVTADAQSRLDVVALPGSAAMPTSSTPMVRELGTCAVETTGDRKFRVLFGPGQDCSVATQFVGEIPPGRAPAHIHPYDEVVLVLEGTGTLHLDGQTSPLAPGTCVHLAPGQSHCLENSSSGLLRVLGVFHPADSPASKTVASS